MSPGEKTSAAVRQQKVIYCSDKLFVPCVMHLTQTNLQRKKLKDNERNGVRFCILLKTPPNQSSMSKIIVRDKTFSRCHVTLVQSSSNCLSVHSSIYTQRKEYYLLGTKIFQVTLNNDQFFTF